MLLGSASMRGTLSVLAVVAGCGDNRPGTGDFQLVGHHDLGARGMNAALAVAGDTVYVGSRIDTGGIAILDVSDRGHPMQIGELPGDPAMSTRELRAVADKNLLVVLRLQCSPELHGCTATSAQPETIDLYDITDRAAPVLRSRTSLSGGLTGKGPHEMYLRRDGDRLLLLVASPPVLLDVLDISDPAAPQKLASWKPPLDHLQGSNDILHSVTMSIDGSKLFLSHQLSGLLIADATQMPEFSLITPVGLDFTPPATVGPHSTVEVPGRPLLIVTEEVYPPPYGLGCPWGTLRTVDISNPAAPAILAELGVAENDPAFCATGTFDRITFTAHNATATHDLAFVTWHAAGLKAIDVSEPTAPRFVATFVPEPLPSVTVEDPGLGGASIEMWSTPVIQDGLLYVVDVRNGLYILRYRGQFASQLSDDPFLEGNSNL